MLNKPARGSKKERKKAETDLNSQQHSKQSRHANKAAMGREEEEDRKNKSGIVGREDDSNNGAVLCLWSFGDGRIEDRKESSRPTKQ